jgi:PAS domain S-box-containing protein
MFDWRALERWRISESLLPPDSVVRFKPPSLWDQYRWFILGAAGLLLAQSVLIVALYLERRSARRAQAVLQEKQQLLELAAGAGELGLWWRDLKDGHVWVNAFVRSLFGFGENEPLGFEDLFQRVHPDDRARVAAVIERAQAADQPFETEFRARLPDGAERWVMAKGRTMPDERGHRRRRMGVAFDITPRISTEIELQQKRGELAHVVRVSLLGELAASLAHELRQPLTAIALNASAALRFLQQEPNNTTEAREGLQDIITANNRASEIIDRLWAMAKKDEKSELATADLAYIIRDVLVLVHTIAVTQDIHVVSEIAASLPPVRGDRVQLEQVVLNLVLNAFEAMKESPAGTRQVIIRAQRRDIAFNGVAVIDRGPGLGDADVNRIFEPFYTTKREGLGMGLSICRSIITQHGGELWAENNPEGGATFHFTLPVRDG